MTTRRCCMYMYVCIGMCIYMYVCVCVLFGPRDICVYGERCDILCAACMLSNVILLHESPVCTKNIVMHDHKTLLCVCVCVSWYVYMYVCVCVCKSFATNICQIVFHKYIHSSHRYTYICMFKKTHIHI
jgi:hypothetical protein